MGNSINKEDIYEVFIFSLDEYLAAVEKVPNIPIEQCCAWWLRSIDNSRKYDAVHFVNQQGEIKSSKPHSRSYAIRPAFHCHNLRAYKPGDKVAVGILTCTVIDATTVLCDGTIGGVYFGENTNYQESHLKETIEDPELLARIYYY